jgi:hypothetical protein
MKTLIMMHIMTEKLGPYLEEHCHGIANFPQFTLGVSSTSRTRIYLNDLR